jgi:hypothetical protein
MQLEPLKEERGQQVLNVIHSYAWSFDSNDMETLASLFSEDATTRGVVKGDEKLGWGPWVGRAIAAQLSDIRRRQVDRRRHQLTTPVFLRLTETDATVKVYLSLFTTVAGEKPRLVTTGQYIANLTNTCGVWKISCLEAELDGPF